MRSALIPVLLLVGACGDKPGGNPNPDPTDTDTAVTVDTSDTDVTLGPQTWHVAGQAGQLFVVDKQRAGSLLKSSYQVYGVFADNVQGLATAAWCQAGGPCLPTIPATGEYVDATPTLLVPDASTWAWNGHHIPVGSVDVPFVYDYNTGLAWYTHSQLENQDASPVAVSFDGEWGRFSGNIEVPPLEIQSPDPAVALPLDDFITFQWTPTGEDDVFLRVATGGFDRVWHLEDDGEFVLDPTTLGIGAGVAAVDIALQRWKIGTHDVNGNELTTYGVWQQPYSALVCEVSDYPIASVPASGAPVAPYVDPASVAVSIQAMIDGEEVYDFWFDYNLDGANDKLSSMLIFTFFDDVGAELCSVAYDASEATHLATPPVPATGNGVIFDAWEVSLSGGYSDCAALDPDIWGTKDVRNILQGIDWGFGIGTIDETEDELDGILTPWGTWEALTAGSYIALDGEWYEVGGVNGVGMVDCGVVDPNLGVLSKPTGSPMPTRLYLSVPVISFSM